MFPTRRITTSGGDVFRDEFSLAFDGTNDFVDCENVLDQGLGDFSISVWFKAGTNIAQYDALCAKRDTNGTGFVMDIRGTDPFLIGFAMTDDSISTRTILGNTSITLDTWNHYIVVVDRTGTNKIYGYLNGVLDINPTNMTTLGSISNTESFGIGGRTVSGSVSNKFVGNISEMAVYNKALSASEVKTLYNGREPYNHKEGVCSSNLQAWYRMGDGRLDQKSTNDLDGGIVTDMVTPTLGSDIFSGRGNFTDNSDNYWSFQNAGGGDNIEIADGVCKYKASGATNGFLEKTGILTVGQMYRIDVDVTLNTGAALIIDDNNPYIKICNASETGRFTVYWKPQNQTKFRLYRHDSTGDAYDQNVNIDNLIVRPVNGNAGALKNFPKSCFKGDTP